MIEAEFKAPNAAVPKGLERRLSFEKRHVTQDDIDEKQEAASYQRQMMIASKQQRADNPYAESVKEFHTHREREQQQKLEDMEAK